MNHKRQNTFFRFSKIAVLLLYIPFFVVQGFFNFGDTQLYQSEHNQTNYKNLAADHHAVTINYGNKKTGKQVNIRLNKRFHPKKNAPLCETISFEIPVYFSEATPFGDYTNPLLGLSYFLTRTLRGPPAII
jgi:hypothetical protein